MNTTVFHFKVKPLMLLTVVLVLLIVLGVTFIAPGKHAYAASVITYPQPSGISASDKFSVTVNGSSSFAYKTTSGSQSATFTTFSTDSAVSVSVTYLAGTINSAVVRPLSYGITPSINSNTMTFTINPNQKVSAEVNGGTTDVALIFSDPLETNIPSPSDPSVVYFSPGVYDLGSNWCFPAGKSTLYLAGGAYVKGTIKCSGVSNVSIRGRGIFSGEGYSVAQYTSNVYFLGGSNHITVDGITFINGPYYGILLRETGNTSIADDDNMINDIKIINNWTTVEHSGLHRIGNHSTAQNSFVMSGDDGLLLAENTVNSTFKNLVMWIGGGDAIQFGWNGNVGYNDLADGIDIIHYTGGNYAGSQAAIGPTQYCSTSDMHDITVQNVRIEGYTNRLFGFQISGNSWCSVTSNFGSIYNLHLNNIQAQYGGSSSNVIWGNSSTSTIHDLTFQNLTIGGQTITSAAQGNFDINQYASNIQFTGSGGGGSSNFWENLGAPASGLADSPDVASQGSNEFDVFARGSDGQLAQKTWNGSSWSGWSALGGPTGNTFQGRPAAISWVSGFLDVFVRGTDNNLWHRWYRSGSWSSTWENLGTPATGLADSPTVASQTSNEFDVFVRGSDGQLAQKTWTGSSWTGWSALGGPTGNTFQGAPTAISWGSGFLDVFVRGTDNNLWQRWYRSGSWSSTWANLGAPNGGLTDSLTVAAQGANEFDVFGRGSDNGLWQKTWNGSSWSNWTSLGGPNNGAFQGAPASFSWGSGFLDVFVRGTDNNLWHRWYRNGVWS